MSTKKITIEDPKVVEANLKIYHKLFQDILNPNLALSDMEKYLFEYKPAYIDSSLIVKEKAPIGFINAAFYKRRINNEDIYIARGAAGVYEKYRKDQFSSMALCIKYMLFKFKHPFTKVYIDGHIASPIMYALMCKYAWKVYPKLGLDEPLEITRIREFLNKNQELVNQRLVNLEFKVTISASDKKRIEQSSNKHILFYKSINPAYGELIGVQTIIPLTFINILYSAAIGILSFIKKRLYPKRLQTKTGE